MTKESLEDIMRKSKWTCEQAANDLERYLLREEPPAMGSVAKAVYVLKEIIGEFNKVRDAENEVNLYTKTRDGVPIAYRYGAPWMAAKLFAEGGFPTPEEAMKEWFDDYAGK